LEGAQHAHNSNTRRDISFICIVDTHMTTMDEVIRFILTFVFAAYLIMYGMRPTVPYPIWVVKSFEHPWIFVIMIIAVPFLFSWDEKIGALFFLITTTLLVDYSVLGSKMLRQ
jgi:hypothetical protein